MSAQQTSTPSLLGKPVGRTGFGLMGLTWAQQQTPDEQAFATMDAALATGSNFWNGGEFYGSPTPTLNLSLINRYFTQNPEAASKVILSIKGGVNLSTFKPDGSPDGIRRSIDNILSHLDGKKFLDIFECARVDTSTPIETTISAIAEYVKAGKVGGIGLSESSASTIRKAHAIHPIAAVEVEFSLFSTEILTNGVASTCAELGIPIVAYSPVGRGFLTGQIKTLSDIPEGDMRRNFERFYPENFDKNIQLVHEIEEVARRKGVTPAQLALSWVRYQSGRDGMPVIVPIPGTTKKERVEENAKEVELSKEDMKEIDGLLKSFTVVGGRYNKHLDLVDCRLERDGVGEAQHLSRNCQHDSVLKR
ncbi:Pyridoxine 4-dehydrogenase [Rhizophlyctis rosea]|uniref:Pyridoxine 4-dehydrogenase n=1 Tax=Rhizophlyctis rosea TaxID=64517 RepID=A0AAD5X7T5_9FUNG|nr:Pyridoxine 4-dehydrogenase [Rhizophlyctis rosea]